MIARRLFGTLALLTLVSACGSGSKPDGKYPERKPGCEVQVFPEEPSYQTDNIGTVSASCDESVSEEACLRELEDQACKLGADTIWGAGHKSELKLGKKVRTGRAAHQK